MEKVPKPIAYTIEAIEIVLPEKLACIVLFIPIVLIGIIYGDL